ncbi:MAG: UDP-N-acetylmuramate dehydrogenase [Defluviitaleaceae bacterium]|nr:UDP-N-acetylmuramate dehydrogenase [Defluviitaleaceae bacterium]
MVYNLESFGMKYLLDEPMSRHTTFKVGGVCDIFLAPASEEELLQALRVCRENGYPHFVIGNGSNLLVKDGGFRGVVISLLQMKEMRLLEGGQIFAHAGVLMKDLAEFARESGLSGVEFIHGIPGSVGGGVFMNAGAYDGEMAHIFVSARCVNQNGNIAQLSNADMNFEYRKSLAQSEGLVVMSAVVQGVRLKKAEISAKMEDLEERRGSKQPLEYASAGSTFKRPDGHFVGKLVEDAGLKGFRIGGAQVSEKHGGFVINRGFATADDILQLINHIQQTIKEKFGVTLETEVKIIGE